MKFSAACAVAAIGALGLVGCGSDEDAGDTVGDDTITSGAVTVDSVSTSSEQTVDETGDDAGVSSDDFCTALEDADSQAGVGTDVEATAAAFENIDEAAPDEISAATGLLREFIDRGIEISELPEAERADAITEIDGLEQEFTDATEQIEDYARENCDNLGEDFFGGSSDTDVTVAVVAPATVVDTEG